MQKYIYLRQQTRSATKARIMAHMIGQRLQTNVASHSRYRFVVFRESHVNSILLQLSSVDACRWCGDPRRLCAGPGHPSLTTDWPLVTRRLAIVLGGPRLPPALRSATCPCSHLSSTMVLSPSKSLQQPIWYFHDCHQPSTSRVLWNANLMRIAHSRKMTVQLIGLPTTRNYFICKNWAMNNRMNASSICYKQYNLFIKRTVVLLVQEYDSMSFS